MHRDQLQFVQPPFQDTVDTSFFFTGGMRRDAVDVIKDALSRGVSLITLTGDDGSGKTMVCRMVQKELAPDLACVFLPQTVESFNEMVQIVAEEIFSEPLEKEKEKDVKALEGQIIQALRESEQRLVIIFDEAEKIFLATLERIRRLVDRVNEQGDFLRVIFSGHTRFIDNLNQLQIVTFQDIEECHVSLDPLDQEATWTYLNQSVEHATEQEGEFFSRDLVDKIFPSAGGNFRKINKLALESLQADKLDTSFLHLLDGIDTGHMPFKKKGAAVKRSRASNKMPEVNLDFLKFPEIKLEWFLYGGGIAAVVLLLFMLVGRSGNKESFQDEDVSDVPVIELKNVDPLTNAEVPESTQTKPLVSSEQQASLEDKPDLTIAQKDSKADEKSQIASAPDEEASEDVYPTVVKVEVQTDTDSTPMSRQELDGMEGEPDSPIDAEILPVQEAPPIAVPPPVPVAPIRADVIDDPGAASEQEEPSESQPPRVAELPTVPSTPDLPDTAEVPETPAINIGKVKERTTQSQALIVLEAGPKKDRAVPREVLKTEQEKGGEQVTIDTGDKYVEQIYKKRLAAGARWLVGGGGKYTIQLMVLTSDEAEENLKNMLKEKNYLVASDQFFILRRVGTIPTVMVFYGEYPTLGAARNARNNLPVFLRKHHPYAISVKGAVAKTNASEQQ